MNMTESASKLSPSAPVEEEAMETLEVIEEVKPEVSDFSPEPALEIDPEIEPEIEVSSKVDLDQEEREDEEIYEEEDEGEFQERQYPYDVPRPALTLDEASYILGKSIRAIERSIQGKWGNRLPEGWQARKMKIDGESEWRIIPPAGFRIRHTVSKSRADLANSEYESSGTTNGTSTILAEVEDAIAVDESPETAKSNDDSKGNGLKLPGFSVAIENFITSASQKAKNEIARATSLSQEADLDMGHPTIVIDRSDDVERLLRELANTRKELAEERRLHMDDLRLLNQMQTSMRLLEDHASQTTCLKDELIQAREALKLHKEQYESYLKLPWWRKLFVKAP